MRYTIRRSIVQVVGKIWMPAATCAQEIVLRPHDIENAKDEEGKLTRDSVEHWLCLHAGDFQSIQDFRASIEDGEETIEIPWKDEESEFTYSDCMFPSEDE